MRRLALMLVVVKLYHKVATQLVLPNRFISKALHASLGQISDSAADFVA